MHYDHAINNLQAHGRHRDMWLQSLLIVAQWQHMAAYIWVTIASCNGLLFDGTKPFLEPMLNNHQLCLTAISREMRKISIIDASLKIMEKYRCVNFRGCVPEMFVASYSATYCIYIPGKPRICFHYYYAVYDEWKYTDTFCLANCTRLFVQYTISLSSLCKIIWRHWTCKIPVRYILSSVWVRLRIFSQLSIIQSITQ